MNRPDKLTTVTAIALVLATLLACKKKQQEETPLASASVAPAPPPPPATVEPPKTVEIKRYAASETAAEGTVRVNFANVKVYREADDHTPELAVLSKSTLVNRKAKFDKFVLVEYLSPTGQLSLGWVEARFLPAQVDKTAKPSDVAKQSNAAAAPSSSAAAAPSSSAPPATTVAAAPTGTATQAAGTPTATATATATATTTATTAPTKKVPGGIVVPKH
jgi:hypothetical protein